MILPVSQSGRFAVPVLLKKSEYSCAETYHCLLISSPFRALRIWLLIINTNFSLPFYYIPQDYVQIEAISIMVHGGYETISWKHDKNLYS